MRTSDNTVGAMLDLYRSTLTERFGVDEARAITRTVFQEMFGWDVAQLDDRRKQRLSESELLKVNGPLERMCDGEPMQYALGHSWFLGMRLSVSPAVLIPRPETEELVDWIIRLEGTPIRVLDIGTGSGCIAIALKREWPNAHVHGVDVSQAALEVARSNAERMGTEVEWKKADVLHPEVVFPSDVDLIVSNPPYIPKEETDTLAEHVLDHEPHLALFVEDTDPLLFYRVIGAVGRTSLVPGGSLWFEGHHRYAIEVGSMLSELGYRDVEVHNDLSGTPRFIHAVR